MKSRFLSIIVASLSLYACGGGSGSGDDGGFQPKAPQIKVTSAKSIIQPNPTGSRLESLNTTSYALVDVFVMQGNRPLENGEEEVYVQTTVNSTVPAVLYCFSAENDDCKETLTNSDGDKVTVARPLSGMPINLNSGRATFAVASSSGKQGTINLQITATGINNSSATVYKDIDVKYSSSGDPYQIRLLGPNVINPNIPSSVAVQITDEAGNPVTNPKSNNVIVTASNLDGTVLGSNGKTGASINTNTIDGSATLSILASQTGFLTLTAQGDSSDNNVSNGIQKLVNTTKVIKVTTDVAIPNDPIQIVTATAPDGVVNIDYEFTIPTSGAAVSGFTVNSGNIPPGLTLSSSGVLSGIPTLAGQYTFTVTAVGVDGSTSSKAITINIVNGGLKFDPEAFKTLEIPKDADCIATAQTLNVVPVNKYTLAPPFEWHMDAGGVQTALGKNKAVPLRNANGLHLTDLELTVTSDTLQVTMNGKVCRSASNDVFNGHAIILNVKDSNGFAFESVLPLIIVKKAGGSGGGTGGGSTDPKKCDDFSPTPPGCNEVTVSNGKVGEVYEITVQGATASSKVIEGSLPPGLELDGGTKIKGTPTKSGTYTVLIGNGTTSQVVYITITD